MAAIISIKVNIVILFWAVFMVFCCLNVLDIDLKLRKKTNFLFHLQVNNRNARIFYYLNIHHEGCVCRNRKSNAKKTDIQRPCSGNQVTVLSFPL